MFLVNSPSSLGQHIHALWKQLDDTLSTEPYLSLNMVQVGYLELNQDGYWDSADGFRDAVQFPRLLPKLHSRHVLTWNHEPDPDLTFR